MAKDLKSFLKNKGKAPNAAKQPQAADFQEIPEDIRSTMEQYEGKSEDELLQDLFAQVDQEKENGGISKESLDAFATQVMPMMDATQRSRMQQVLGMLKQRLD